MKTLKMLSLLSFCFTFLVAQQSDPCPTYAQYMKKTQAKKAVETQKIAIIQKLYTALAQGDLMQIHNLLAPKIEWNHTANFPYKGFDPHTDADVILSHVFENTEQGWHSWTLHNLQFEETFDGEIMVNGNYQAKHQNHGNTKVEFTHLLNVQEGQLISFQSSPATNAVFFTLK